MGVRPERIASQMKEYVSSIVYEEIKDPRIGFITVTRIEVTPDLRNAKIFFSVFGDKEDKQRALEGLNSAAGYIRKSLAEKLGTRFTPELLFRLDESAEYSIHLNEIFDKIKKEKEDKDERP
ncbi:MAG: 30S ribosome-binding factor RbfA [Candidatus Omnitrophota bacterium]